MSSPPDLDLISELDNKQRPNERDLLIGPELFRTRHALEPIQNCGFVFMAGPTGPGTSHLIDIFCARVTIKNFLAGIFQASIDLAIDCNKPNRFQILKKYFPVNGSAFLAV